MVVRQVANNTIGAAADQRAAVAADPRAGATEVAADCLAGGSPQVMALCSCPAAASAGAAVASAGAAVASAGAAVASAGAAVTDAAAAGSAGAAADCDTVAVAVDGDGCVVAAAVAVAVPDVVVFLKLLPTLPDSAAAAGVGVVGAVELFYHS